MNAERIKSRLLRSLRFLCVAAFRSGSPKARSRSWIRSSKEPKETVEWSFSCGLDLSQGVIFKAVDSINQLGLRGWAPACISNQFQTQLCDPVSKLRLDTTIHLNIWEFFGSVGIRSRSIDDRARA